MRENRYSMKTLQPKAQNGIIGMRQLSAKIITINDLKSFIRALKLYLKTNESYSVNMDYI